MQNKIRPMPLVRLLLPSLLFVMIISAIPAEETVSPRVKIREWSFVYQGTYLKTLSGSEYMIHSPGFNLTSRNDWRLPLLSSTTIFVPSGIMNNGTWSGGLSEYYSSRIGLEQIFAFELSGKIGDLWRWRGAPGWSINGISMPGEVGYYPFQSLTSGPAVLLGFDRDWEQGLTIRLTAGITYQFIDFIHTADKLDYGISGHIGVGIGFKKGAFMGRYSDES